MELDDIIYNWSSVESLEVRVNDWRGAEYFPNINHQKYSRAEDFWR